MTRLLAVIDHRHIFVDPNPNSETSWEERKRLFDMPRSSWADYDPTLISKGGGILSRNQKEINLSPQVTALTALERMDDCPGEIINAPIEHDNDLQRSG